MKRIHYILLVLTAILPLQIRIGPAGAAHCLPERSSVSRPAQRRPVIPLPAGVSPAALSSHVFTTASVETDGKVHRRIGTPTQQYEEDLGGGVILEMVAVKGDRQTPPFWMGKYEVTQEQWRAVMDDNPSNFKGALRPVETIGWDEVKEYCRRLNDRSGLTERHGYRLPTEAQWEYAARAGTTTQYAFGDTLSPEIVNYDGNYPDGGAPKGLFRRETVEVGSLGVANDWGLYDLHGNVWEWCEPVTPSKLVIRGGSWSSFAAYCRSSYRLRYTTGYRRYGVGFRLTRTVP